jgi:Domain of unknown function (DUF1788)
MGQVEDLADRFGRYLQVRASVTGVAAERVLVVVYEKELERTLRSRFAEFRNQAEAAGRTFKQTDCTTMFADWMEQLDYRETYFAEPELLGAKIEGDFKRFVIQRLREALRGTDANTVVAVTGTASLYGFVRLSEIIREVDAETAGCLAVFFPGTKDSNNYRLLDARDGWNYLAHSISLHT